MLAEFNVLTEPWITAVALDGTEREYGLLDVLTMPTSCKA